MTDYWVIKLGNNTIELSIDMFCFDQPIATSIREIGSHSIESPPAGIRAAGWKSVP